MNIILYNVELLIAIRFNLRSVKMDISRMLYSDRKFVEICGNVRLFKIIKFIFKILFYV